MFTYTGKVSGLENADGLCKRDIIADLDHLMEMASETLEQARSPVGTVYEDWRVLECRVDEIGPIGHEFFLLMEHPVHGPVLYISTADEPKFLKETKW